MFSNFDTQVVWRDRSLDPLIVPWPHPGMPVAFLQFGTHSEWSAFIERQSIHPVIPRIVSEKFQRSQKLYALAWLEFDLIKMGELGALIALEAALKDRYGAHFAKISKKPPKFEVLLRHMVEGDGLTDDALPYVRRYGGSILPFLYETSEIQAARQKTRSPAQPTVGSIRNGLAHGDPFEGAPWGGLLELARDLIDYAYRDLIAEAATSPYGGVPPAIAETADLKSDPDKHDVFGRFTERWPKAGDRLFTPARDTQLAEAPVERNFRLLRGYKRAGDVLVQAACSEPYDRASLVFPALFNYRHYIELALKSAIEIYGDVAGVTLRKVDHKLPDLWALFVQLAAAFHLDGTDPALQAVGACIREISSIDANSTVFRYAKDRKGGTPSLPRDGLDLVRLHDVMNGIENFFECAELDFAQKSEHRAESHNVI